jgi:hypothetical protein
VNVRFVAPYRPFPPEAPHHQELAAFDWIAAIRQMSDSVQRVHPGCPVHVITDVDTDLPVPTLQYDTRTRRLMLWYLEICACYLLSTDFDRDTIMLDSDQLIYGDLTKWFAPYMDLGICVRRTPKNAPGLPILNGVQFWPIKGKRVLAEFYLRALEIAQTLSEKDLVWGADTVALDRLLAPLQLGIQQRDGVRVRLIDANDVIEALSQTQIRHLSVGKMQKPTRPVLCFRNTRKPFMADVYRQTIATEVSA